jgi:hypothetical protein
MVSNLHARYRTMNGSCPLTSRASTIAAFDPTFPQRLAEILARDTVDLHHEIGPECE